MTTAAALSGAAAAHDFWMDADRWSLPQSGGEVRLDFSAGHSHDVLPWTLRPEREVLLETIDAEGRRGQNDSLILPTGGARSGAALNFGSPGVKIVAFSTDNYRSVLGAERFNAYIDEEGLTPAIEHRRRMKQEARPGRELYSRRSKALIAVGDVSNAPAPSAIGQTLEIVPIENPFALGIDDPLHVRIDYEGAPLAGAKVSFERLGGDSAPKIDRITDANGVADFRFPKEGAWKIDVVWTRPVAEGVEADFETVFSSLTFGY